MKIDRIRISKEFHNGMTGRWVGAEASIDSDDIQSSYKKIEAEIDTYVSGLNQGFLQVGRPDVKVYSGGVPDKINNKEIDAAIEEEYNHTMTRIKEASTKEEASDILQKSGFQFNIELQNIVNSKTN